jgi:hypothetical protein
MEEVNCSSLVWLIVDGRDMVRKVRDLFPPDFLQVTITFPARTSTPKTVRPGFVTLQGAYIRTEGFILRARTRTTSKERDMQMYIYIYIP